MSKKVLAERNSLSSNYSSTFGHTQTDISNTSIVAKIRRRWEQFLAGRNGIAIFIKIFVILARVLIGVIDEVSDWYFIFLKLGIIYIQVSGRNRMRQL